MAHARRRETHSAYHTTARDNRTYLLRATCAPASIPRSTLHLRTRTAARLPRRRERRTAWATPLATTTDTIRRDLSKRDLRYRIAERSSA